MSATLPLGTRVWFDIPGAHTDAALIALLSDRVPGARPVYQPSGSHARFDVPAHGADLFTRQVAAAGRCAEKVGLSQKGDYEPPLNELAMLERMAASELSCDLWGMARPFQRQGVTLTALSGSGMLWWRQGAGKTIGAILWAMTGAYDPARLHGGLITVCKCSARRQWGRQVRRFTAIEPWVSDPSARRSVGWEPLPDYLARMWATGRRPWLIVGWEELAQLVFGDAAHITEGTVADRERRKQKDQPPTFDPINVLSAVPFVGRTLGAKVWALAGGTAEGLAALTPDQLQSIPRISGRAVEALRRAIPVLELRDTSRDNLGALGGPTVAAWKWDIVFDEIHFAKSKKRKKWIEDEDGRLRGYDNRNLTSAAQRMAGLSRRALGTTGSPIADKPRDLWGLLSLLEPRGWGGYWKFANRYCGVVHKTIPGAFNRDGAPLTAADDRGASNTAELRWRLGIGSAEDGEPLLGEDGTWREEPPAWAFVSQVPRSVSHGQLPPICREVIRLAPESVGWGDKDAFRATMARGNKNDRIARQLEWLATRKRPWLLDQLAEHVQADEPVIVMTPLISDAINTANAVAKKFPRVPVYLAHGGISDREFDEGVVRFSETRTAAIYVATIDKAGESTDGLHIHSAAMYVMAPPITVRKYTQLEGRVDRLGRVRAEACRIVYPIVEGTIEEAHARLQAEKSGMADEVLRDTELERTAIALGARRATEEVFDEMFKLIGE